MSSLLRFHYAWVVVALTGLVLLASAGIRTAPQALITPLEREFGWPRDQISFAVALSILWFGLGGPVAGTLVDKLGLRRMMVVGLLLIVLGLAALLMLASLWQLHLFWGVMVGVGTGMIANVLAATVAARWFRRHRGVVVGALSAAAAAGQLVFLPGMMALNDTVGWRGALLVAAGAIAVLVLPVWALMHEHPNTLGLRPYGETADSPPETAPAGAPAEERTPLSQAARTRDFWLLAGSFFVCGYTTNGLVGTHLLPHALEHGFEGTLAASALGLMGLMNVVGTLGSGWLSDRFDNRVLLAAYYGFRALSLLFLPWVADFNGLLIFSIVYGLDWIATVPPTINLTAQRFGRHSVGVLYGWIFFAHMVGAALAAYLGGLLRVHLGDYTLAFISAATLGFIASVLALGVLPQRRLAWKIAINR